MKANELRIRNLVSDDEGKISTVESIELCPSDFGYAIHMKDSFYINKVEDVNPIPLNEEWLVKFGFEKRHIPSLGMIRYFIWIDKIRRPKNVQFEQFAVDLISERYIFSNPQIEIKYIHQLQNLYFALTGEELKLSITL